MVELFHSAPMDLDQAVIACKNLYIRLCLICRSFFFINTWPKHPCDVLFVEECLFVAAARPVEVQTIVRRVPEAAQFSLAFMAFWVNGK